MATGIPMPPMVSALDPPSPQCSTITASAALTATRPHAPSTSSLTSFTIFTPLAKTRSSPWKKHVNFLNRKQEERLYESQASSSTRHSATAQPPKQLQEFASSHKFLGSKGPLCVALVITRMAVKQGLPLDAGKWVTAAQGQVLGLGQGAVQAILEDYGIPKVLAAEGGRTSRGSMGKHAGLRRIP